MRKFVLSLTTLIAGISMLASVLAVTNTPVASAHEGEDHADSGQVQAAATNEPSEITYNYTAQAGDSYTKIARKAMQTYGLKNKVSLSRAKIVYAETNLTQEAGSPALNEGQKVGIKESTVKKWVDNAGKLTAAQEAAWQRYVPFVDFDTRAVGQAK